MKQKTAGYFWNKKFLVSNVSDVVNLFTKNRCVCRQMALWSLCHFMVVPLLQAPSWSSNLATWIQHLQNSPWKSRKTSLFCPCRRNLSVWLPPILLSLLHDKLSCKLWGCLHSMCSVASQDCEVFSFPRSTAARAELTGTALPPPTCTMLKKLLVHSFCSNSD